MLADPAGEVLDRPVIAVRDHRGDIHRGIPFHFDVKGEPLLRVLFTAGEYFVVFGEPALGGQPGKCVLHDPAPPEMFYALHLPGQRRFDPLDEAALPAQFYHDAIHIVPFLMRLF